MGIDYVVVSTVNPELYKGPEQFLKWAWQDIEWEKIMELLGIKMYILYDCGDLGYWSTEHVEIMYKEIKNLYEDPKNAIICSDDLEDALKLHDDTYMLMNFFKEYVDNKCIIRVF